MAIAPTGAMAVDAIPAVADREGLKKIAAEKGHCSSDRMMSLAFSMR